LQKVKVADAQARVDITLMPELADLATTEDPEFIWVEAVQRCNHPLQVEEAEEAHSHLHDNFEVE